MRILFGPAHDGLHISPDTPGAYEWWYFDALSDDGRFALVAIFFLGTPMSPYYKAVVDGKNPLPRDWCGVFFTLHENVNGRWKERAYAYNLYRNATFEDDLLNVQIGNSRLRKVATPDGKQAWHLQIEERGLWRHTLRADLHFVLDVAPLSLPEQGDVNNAHTWACVAPQCQVIGTVTLPSGKVPLYSKGYHDHNFGQLPWRDAEEWYWGRTHIYDSITAVYYFVYQSKKEIDAFLLVTDREKLLTVEQQKFDDILDDDLGHLIRNPYGLMWDNSQSVEFDSGWWVGVENGTYEGPDVASSLLDGPFYSRFANTVAIAVGEDHNERRWEGRGIAEVFRPARLCGPIASRAMWSRIRRRS